MINSPTLSVIIAVYKAEKTLVRALDSIFRQRDLLDAPDEVEVIAVDDASPDRCGEILEEYRVKHPELKVVTHSENRREAGARNSGIENSGGEYFTFLDADDEYAPNALKTILGAIKKNHPDLIHYCYSRYTPDGKFISQTRFRNPGFHLTTSEDEPTLEAVYHDTAFGLMTSGGVYRLAIAPALRFSPEFPISPDRHFGWEFFRLCRNVMQIDESLYIYYQYSDSVSRRLTNDAVSGLLRLDRIFWEEFKTHPLFPKAWRYGFRRLFAGVIGWHFDIVFGGRQQDQDISCDFIRNLSMFLTDITAKDLGAFYQLLRLAVRTGSPFVIRVCRFPFVTRLQKWIPL